MSVVIPLDAYRRDTAIPPLVFLEAHSNQLASDEFDDDQILIALKNCRNLLDAARFNGWPVGFVTPLRPALDEHSRSGAAWIEGFEPQRHDLVFDRMGPSCYTSREFADAITESGNVFVVAGFSSEAACLATLIDAGQYGHKVGLVEDASVSRKLPGLDAAASHQAVIAVAGRYATITCANHWIAAAEKGSGLGVSHGI